MFRFETLRAELVALASCTVAMPVQGLVAPDSLDAASYHSTPVVLVHGLFGSPSNFWALRRHLTRHGVSRFASFAYAPRIDFQTLASRLGGFLDDLCERIGVPAVDVVGHSLGGIIARYLIEQGDGRRVRRLASLGSPWYGARFPARELALFAAEDWLIPAPATRGGPGQVVIVRDCSHLGLLYNADVLQYVANHLTAPARTTRLATRRLPEAA